MFSSEKNTLRLMGRCVSLADASLGPMRFLGQEICYIIHFG